MTTSVTEIPGYVAGTWDIDPARSRIGFEAPSRPGAGQGGPAC